MRTIGVLLLPDTRAFDLSVVCEVWGHDRISHGIGPFELRLCAPKRATTMLRPFGSIAATHGLSGLDGCDLVIALGRRDHNAPVPESARSALRRAHAAG